MALLVWAQEPPSECILANAEQVTVSQTTQQPFKQPSPPVVVPPS